MVHLCGPVEAKVVACASCSSKDWACGLDGFGFWAAKLVWGLGRARDGELLDLCFSDVGVGFCDVQEVIGVDTALGLISWGFLDWADVEGADLAE